MAHRRELLQREDVGVGRLGVRLRRRDGDEAGLRGREGTPSCVCLFVGAGGREASRFATASGRFGGTHRRGLLAGLLSHLRAL